MTTWRSYLFGLGPVILVWAVLVSWLAWLIMDRSRRNDESDQAAVREWLDETRNFRKTLPELLREASRLRNAEAANAGDIRLKDEEIEEQLRALNEPLRSYPNRTDSNLHPVAQAAPTCNRACPRPQPRPVSPSTDQGSPTRQSRARAPPTSN